MSEGGGNAIGRRLYIYAIATRGRGVIEMIVPAWHGAPARFRQDCPGKANRHQGTAEHAGGPFPRYGLVACECEVHVSRCRVLRAVKALRDSVFPLSRRIYLSRYQRLAWKLRSNGSILSQSRDKAPTSSLHLLILGPCSSRLSGDLELCRAVARCRRHLEKEPYGGAWRRQAVRAGPRIVASKPRSVGPRPRKLPSRYPGDVRLPEIDDREARASALSFARSVREKDLRA